MDKDQQPTAAAVELHKRLITTRLTDAMTLIELLLESADQEQARQVRWFGSYINNAAADRITQLIEEEKGNRS